MFGLLCQMSEWWKIHYHWVDFANFWILRNIRMRKLQNFSTVILNRQIHGFVCTKVTVSSKLIFQLVNLHGTNNANMVVESVLYKLYLRLRIDSDSLTVKSILKCCKRDRQIKMMKSYNSWMHVLNWFVWQFFLIFTLFTFTLLKQKPQTCRKEQIIQRLLLTRKVT